MAIAGVRMWLFLVALTLLGLSSAAAEEGVDCSKMKTKELKQFLARKGKKCEGCMEKADFVSLCAASIDLPDVPEEEQPQQKAKKKASAGDDKAKSIDELLASMKGMPGMENIKVFRPGDLEDMMKKGDMGGMGGMGRGGDDDEDKEEL